MESHFDLYQLQADMHIFIPFFDDGGGTENDIIVPAGTLCKLAEVAEVIGGALDGLIFEPSGAVWRQGLE